MSAADPGLISSWTDADFTPIGYMPATAEAPDAEIVEAIECATGLNGQTLLDQLRREGLTVMRTGARAEIPTGPRVLPDHSMADGRWCQWSSVNVAGRSCPAGCPDSESVPS
jgi:hypothetical protein